MRRALLTSSLFLALAAPARGAVPHTVEPGETLWSIAAANGFTTRSLAAYNGLSEYANVVLGSTVMIPTEPEAAAALAGAPASATPATSSSNGSTSASSAPGPMGATRSSRATPSRGSPPEPGSPRARWRG